ncbi:putative thiamine transporter SLC35F3 [Exaiptasia diaphana]|nr:putative thiamine transporter SLC35F3 [Exaiptasia diaphana]
MLGNGTLSIVFLSMVPFERKELDSVCQVLAVLLSICGIVLMAYTDGFKGASAVGVVLSLGAAVGAALYKVLFKKTVGDATAPQVALFLSFLGVISTFLLWPIILILYYTQTELIHWNNIPWSYLCGTSSLNLVFNYAINFGIAFTYPLFISLGIVLGIPINALVDAIFRQKSFNGLKIVSAFLIIIGFTLMLVPDSYEYRLQNKLTCKKVNEDNGEQDSLINNS